MSVSLLEVLQDAGYDVENNVADAIWLLGQKEEFEELYEKAEELEEDYYDKLEKERNEEDECN